jgi:transaldolase
MKLADILPEKEIKEAVLGEYEKRLVLYKFTDEQLKKKYKMSFKEFDEKNVVRKKGFSWDVEQDAMNWEHAVEGIRHLKEKIRKIKALNAKN